MMKGILVTGGAGFIGSNLVVRLVQQYPDYKIVNLDALTYAGTNENVREVENHPRYRFIKGNICNRELVEYVFKEHDIKGVFHLAAETHVDNSIMGPTVFMNTNLMGTFTLVDVAYRYWMEKPFQYKEIYQNCRFHHISTDEVFGTLGDSGLFSEKTAYAPNPPYAASKAGADFIVRSYHHTFGLNTTMSNCSNNYGPKQHAEKLIPTIIRKALAGESIPIYGNGKNVRDWLHVEDHCCALDLIYHKGRAGESYNVGCWNEQNNNTIAAMVCEILDRLRPQKTSYNSLITYVTDRPGHDLRYAIDARKIQDELKWKAQHTFQKGLEDTVRWYVEIIENKYKK